MHDERKHEEETPLDLIMKDIDTNCPGQYAMHKIKNDAETFSSLKRHRTFLLGAHKDVGGQDYMDEVLVTWESILGSGNLAMSFAEAISLVSDKLVSDCIEAKETSPLCFY